MLRTRAAMAAKTSMTSNCCSLLVFFLFSLLHLPVIEARSYLLAGSSLSVEDGFDVLISSGNTFTCGFYSLNGSYNANWLAIWFTIDKTVVWMANRDMPVNKRGSKVTLRNDGTMVLTDFDGSVAWQTNTISTNAYKAELLESGNLVLTNRSGVTLWQSFDYPTDTLLPTQPFTNSKKLTSGLGKYMFSSGYYSLFFDSNSVLTLAYNGPIITSMYWPDPDNTIYQNQRTNYNSSRIAQFDEMGRFSSSDGLQFNAWDMGHGIQRRLKMDPDGNLRLYSLNASPRSWAITWQAVLMPCSVHGLCGSNGVCIYTTEEIKCACLSGFEQADPSDWAQGCKPTFNASSDDSEFVKFTHTDYYGFDLNYTGSGSSNFSHCEELCLRDYRCKAFNYKADGQGMCWTKGELFNGHRNPTTIATIYLRLPKKFPPNIHASELVCNNTGELPSLLLPRSYNTMNHTIWGYLCLLAGTIALLEILIVAIGWWILFSKNGVPALLEDGYRAVSTQFRRFSYAELKKATMKFKSVLGKGGSGEVYKGTLADGKEVAVKRLAEAILQGEEQFWAEVSMIGKIYHMNLVRMWGFCLDRKRRLLVYEYIENGSLDKHLFNGGNLNWKERFKIAVGTARGLAYLHHECLEWIIHCDIKPENILLDENFEPKIADFGLAKLSQRGGAGSEFSKIRGTKGYMAPEWASNLPITAKADVYSYGVVILELVTGIRLSSRVTGDDHQEQVESELTRFVRTAKGKLVEVDDSWLEGMVDTRLNGNFIRKQAKVMIEIGISCVSEDRSKRPTMETVAQVLIRCEEEMPVHVPL